MNKFFIKILCVLMIFSATNIDLLADINRNSKDVQNKIQREVKRVKDVQKNTVSNIEFYTTNYGVFGYDVLNSRGGGFWPRGSQNQYIFAGGVWFAAQKPDPRYEDQMKKYVTITYNPNSGSSWMVPGRIEDGDAEESTNLTDYRVYFSTDFNTGDGVPIDPADGANWPIWDASEYSTDTLKVNRYFGYYIYDTESRTRNIYEKGPAFISEEDIFSTFKDTDLSNYDGGAGRRRQEGYPLRLQFENTIYSWGFGDYKDFIFMKYDIINYSTDTLWNCWLAPVLDIDIATKVNSQAGAGNDRVDFYAEDPSLNLAYQWTDATQGEGGKGFGYLGFDFLESPAVKKCEGVVQKMVDNVPEDFCWQCTNWETITVYDSVNNVYVDKEVCTDSLFFQKNPPNGVNDQDFVRKDKRAYLNKEQLGLVTFRNWPITEDKKEDAERYDFISSKAIDRDNGPGDKRFMMATGPFNFLPKDTVRVVYGIILANTAVRENADGSVEDTKELIRKDKFAQRVYDNNFQAPAPPEKARAISWQALNNAIVVKWDTTAEMAYDVYEDGLDFLGYRLYRARETNVDTFDVNKIEKNIQYSSGKSPYGWKQIAQWELPLPFYPSSHRAGKNPNDQNMPYIDSLIVVGPHMVEGEIDMSSIDVMRIGKGINLWPKDYLVNDTSGRPYLYYDNATAVNDTMMLFPAINNIDTALASDPWGKYYKTLFDIDGQKDMQDSLEFSQLKNQPKSFVYRSAIMWSRNPVTGKATHNYLLDSVLVGVVKLNQALLDYNPLYWHRETITFDTPRDTLALLDRSADTFNLKDTYKWINVGGENKLTMQRLVPYEWKSAMKDSAHLVHVQDSLYKYIQDGKIEFITFPDFESNPKTKLNVILPYMAKITNNRTYVDIGDDNHNNVIDLNDNPEKTERLINSIDYHYKILAYDQGDYQHPTPEKLNTGGPGLPDYFLTNAGSGTSGDKSTFEIISTDKNELGGLYNFKFFAIDQDRVNQEFENDTLELEFKPYWFQQQFLRSSSFWHADHYFGLYRMRIRLRDISKDNELLYDGITNLEPILCNLSYSQMFTEDAASYVFADSTIIDSITGQEITFGLPYNNSEIVRSGHFETGDFSVPGYCYTLPMQQPALGTIGFSFDYTIVQKGGVFRPYSAEKISGNATTPINFITDVSDGSIDGRNAEYISDPFYGSSGSSTKNNVLTTQWVADDTLRRFFGRQPQSYYLSPVYGSFNNGPGEYLVTFQDGGVETMELTWGSSGSRKTATFNVPYLTYQVENVVKYNRRNLNEKDSVTVTYPGIMEHMVLPDYFKAATYNTSSTSNAITDIERFVPDPRNLGRDYMKFIGKYNAQSYAWVNARDVASPLKLKNVQAHRSTSKRLDEPQDYIGTQGRYYLSASGPEGDQVDFVNVLNISGCWFVFDYANKGRPYWYTKNLWETQNDYQYGEDFKSGDQVKFTTTGGALGFPLPGATVRAKVTKHDVNITNYTDKLLDQIKIVPNPYYVSHLGQKSPYDAKIYFTKLPPRCTIDIYTSTGSLIKSFEHNEIDSPDPSRVGVDIWDLMSRNNQRVQSQVLVAVIKTPNGAQTIKNFSLVVGGFRLITTDE